MKISGIYCITNQINDKKYIGQSINIKKRLSNHKYYLKKGTHINKHLQASFNKYGINNFSFEILHECEPEQLDEMEIKLIKKYDTTNDKKGYNHEYGGVTVKKPTLKSKIKRRGKWHHAISPKTKDNYAFRNHCTELWDTHRNYESGDYNDIDIRLPFEDINQLPDYDYNLKSGRNPDDYIVTVKEKHVDKYNINVPDYYGEL